MTAGMTQILLAIGMVSGVLVLLLGLVLLHRGGLAIQRRRLERGLNERLDRERQNFELQLAQETAELKQELGEATHQVHKQERWLDEYARAHEEYDYLLREANGYLARARPLAVNARVLRHAIADMERVWLDSNSTEESCRVILENNSWVLWPDYEIEELYRERNIKNAAKLLFRHKYQKLKSSDYNIPTNDNIRLDLFGWANARASLQPSHVDEHKKLILIVELKAPRVTLHKAALQQIYSYVIGLMAHAASELWGRQIDCLVIGGTVGADANDLHLRFGEKAHAAVRITPLSYAQLIVRAKTICRKFFDEVERDQPQGEPAPEAEPGESRDLIDDVMIDEPQRESGEESAPAFDRLARALERAANDDQDSPSHPAPTPPHAANDDRARPLRSRPGDSTSLRSSPRTRSGDD